MVICGLKGICYAIPTLNCLSFFQCRPHVVESYWSYCVLHFWAFQFLPPSKSPPFTATDFDSVEGPGNFVCKVWQSKLLVCEKEIHGIC